MNYCGEKNAFLRGVGTPFPQEMTPGYADGFVAMDTLID